MVCLETNRDHSVTFEIASKYCILNSFVDHDGYSISSNGFFSPNQEGLSLVDIFLESVEFLGTFQ